MSTFFQQLQQAAEHSMRERAMQQQQGLALAQLAQQGVEGTRGHERGMLGLQMQDEASMRQHQLGLGGLDLQALGLQQQDRHFGQEHGLRERQMGMQEQMFPYQYRQLQDQERERHAMYGLSKIIGGAGIDSFRNVMSPDSPEYKVLSALRGADMDYVRPMDGLALIQLLMEISGKPIGQIADKQSKWGW